MKYVHLIKHFQRFVQMVHSWIKVLHWKKCPDLRQVFIYPWNWSCLLTALVLLQQVFVLLWQQAIQLIFFKRLKPSRQYIIMKLVVHISNQIGWQIWQGYPKVQLASMLTLLSHVTEAGITLTHVSLSSVVSLWIHHVLYKSERILQSLDNKLEDKGSLSLTRAKETVPVWHLPENTDLLCAPQFLFTLKCNENLNIPSRGCNVCV